MKVSTAVSTSALLALFIGVIASTPGVSAQEAVTSPSAAAAGVEAVTAPSESPAHNSKVRIVRLSEVKGEVQLDRETGKGFEGAMANLPVIEGSRLKTGNGVAEVEFEDNSTVRVAPNSLIEFPRLEMLPSGAKTSAVHVQQGMVYVNLMNTKGNEFALTFGQQKLNLPPDSHIRVQLTPDQATVAVLHGDAIVEGPAGSSPVTKNKTMTFNLASQSDPVIAKSVTEQPLDSWDHDAVQYHKAYANATSFGNSPYAYGINDMNYYGSFINASGCGGGSMWRPYFAGANWDPYGSGAWAWYQNAGYSWVSPYPWGWTPYHYGSWSFCQGIGWGWQPGGSWMGLANNSFASSPTRPRPPVHAPVSAQATLVPVNLKAIPASSLEKNDKFVFRADSAGLGVPRGSLGKLNSFSGQTMQHGMATTNVYRDGERGGMGAEHEGRAGINQSASSGNSASSRSYSSSMQSASSAASSHASSGASGGSSGGGGRH